MLLFELPEPMVALEPDDEPALEPAAVPVVALPVLPPWVPVVPMGVLCELCWPAPVAALGLAVVGGVPCAMAVPTTATVARPASNVFSGFDAVIGDSLM